MVNRWSVSLLLSPLVLLGVCALVVHGQPLMNQLLFSPVVFRVCALVVVHGQHPVTQLNIGFLLPISSARESGKKAAPGVVLAMEEAQKMLPSVRLNWSYADSGSEERSAVTAAIRLKHQFSENLNVLFGVQDSQSCEAVAFIAEAINAPFVSFGCKSDRLGERDLFKVFARTVPPYKDLVPALSEALKQLRLNEVRTYIVATSEPVYQQLSGSVKKDLDDRLESKHGVLADTRRMIWQVMVDRISDLELNDARYEAAKSSLSGLTGNTMIILFLMSARDVVFYLSVVKGLGLIDGDHVFMTLDYSYDLIGEAEYYRKLGTVRDVFKLQESLITVSFKIRPKDVTSNLLQEFNAAYNNPKFLSDKSLHGTVIQADEVDAFGYVGHMYDSVMMWAHIMSLPGSLDILQEQMSAARIVSLILKMSSFRGMFGTVELDKDGERVPAGFDVFMVQKGKFINIMSMNKSAEVDHHVNYDSLTLANGDKIPSDVSDCAITDTCLDRQNPFKDHRTIIIALGVFAGCLFLAVVAVLIIFLIRRYIQNKETIRSWIIHWSDITVLAHSVSANNLSYNAVSTKGEVSSVMTDSVLPGAASQLFVTTGVYKGVLVAIKKINRESVDPYSQEIHEELRQMLDIKHENVNEFVGVCCEAPNVSVLMAYAHKGSLQDVIFSDTVTFSNELRLSLAMDIVKGMDYLHNSNIGPHGQLSSSNCVVSRLWICKITDYGLKAFKLSSIVETNSYQEAIELMWSAPELLRKDPEDPDRFYGTKEGDVYSFGIIVSELLTCDAPYRTALMNFTPADIIYRVRRGMLPPLRPILSNLAGENFQPWIELAESCWHEEPRTRPTFSNLKDLLKNMNDGKRINILDWLYRTLEQSLETKNAQLADERGKIQRLMYSLVPKSVADVLIEGNEAGPQMSNPATVAFFDLVGMDKLLLSLTPSQISEAFTGLWRRFDGIIRLYAVHKVGTDVSSEGTMIISGIPERSITHASDMCTLVLHLLSTLFLSKVTDLQLRSGIGSGPVIALVIGKVVPRYRVFGKAVDQSLAILAVSREASFWGKLSPEQQIRVSKSVVDNLAEGDEFLTKPAGQIRIKDDKIDTFWLINKKGLDLALPNVTSR